jgi:hypothetical protein
MSTRRARGNPDRCRSCGDSSLLDPDTFEPTGYCLACSATPVHNAARAQRASRAADRETRPVRSDPANGPYQVIQTTYGEVRVNADGEPL